MLKYLVSVVPFFAHVIAYIVLNIDIVAYIWSIKGR